MTSQNPKCPRCPAGQVIEWPPVITDQVEWSYCPVHRLRWRTGVADETPPAGTDGGAEFLGLFAATKPPRTP